MNTTITKAMLLSLISSTLLMGCSSGSNLPKSGVTTEEVYYSSDNSTENNNHSANQVLWRSSTDYERSEVDVYTLHNSPRVPYQTLVNPTVYFYVPPKLSETDRVPIPGYFSEFKMYEKEEYALPGERNLSNGEMYKGSN